MRLYAYYLLLIALLFTFYVSGQSMQGPNSAKTATEQYLGCLGCLGTDWMNINNVKVSDGVYASTQFTAYPQCFQTSCYYSRGLVATNFGFTIPSNAMITGVKADIQRLAGAANTVYDSAVYLVENSLRIGNNRPSVIAWPITDAYASYGDSADLWNATLSPADVNDTTFGIIVKPYNTATSGFTPADIDHIELSVYYKIATGIATSAAINEISITVNPDNILIRFNVEPPQQYYSLTLFDMTGRRIYLKEFNIKDKGNVSEFINTEELSGGLYIVNISGTAGNISKKLMIPASGIR